MVGTKLFYHANTCTTFWGPSACQMFNNIYLRYEECRTVRLVNACVQLCMQKLLQDMHTELGFADYLHGIRSYACIKVPNNCHIGASLEIFLS